jgi:hypothetical protein
MYLVDGHGQPSRRPANPDLVKRIAVVLGLSDDELLASCGYLPDVYSTISIADRDVLAVLRLLADTTLSPSEKDWIRSFLRLLVDRYNRVRV